MLNSGPSDIWRQHGGTFRNAVPKLLSWVGFRGPLFVLCLAALVWLVINPSPAERRASAVNEALQRGEIGALTSNERALLQKLLEDLVTAANVNLPVALNKPLNASDGETDQIRVFTTSPAAASVTGNGRGNASYDSTMDAIFIDLDIVRPARAVQMYANIRIFDEFEDPSYAYLSFVFLHELGHRVLHRHRRSSLDTILQLSDGEAQKYEREADLFALGGLRAYYDKFHMIGLDPDAGNVAGEGFDGALAEMIDSSSRSLLFSAVPYSPFYSDAAHPTFLSRTLGFLESTAVAESRISDRLRLVQYGLSRMNEVATRPLLEIQVPDTIASATSTKDGISIVGKNGLSYLADHSLLASLGVTRGVEHVVALPTVAKPEPVGLNMATSDIGSAAGNFQIGSNLFLPVDYPGRVPSEGLPMPARSPTLFVAALRRVGAFSHLTDQDAERARERLIEGLQTINLTETTGFMLLGVVNRRAYALLFDLANGGEILVGIATIDTADLSNLQLEPLNLESWQDHTSKLLKFHVVPRSAGPDYYVIGDRWKSQGPESTGAEICVWKVSRAPPELVACHPLVAAFVPGWRNGSGWPYGAVLLMTTVWSRPDSIVANVHGDSVYAFDLTGRQSRMVFHPAGLNIVALPAGEVLFYATGGHKAFVIKLCSDCASN